ncbi:MAG: isochorismatase family cysteine hydrolase [Candidatus Sericytochromatia bacterium]
MPARNLDLHGNAPDSCPVALLLIDVINDFAYTGGDKLLAQTLPIADKILALKRKSHRLGIPVIYVNDNFGRWQSDFKKVLCHCIEESMGSEIAHQLAPDEDDYFVLKPKHSGFYSTTLDTLLNYLQVQTLILTGIAGDSCVLFTANDAYMRDFRLIIPADCVASQDPEENRRSLEQMKRVLKADIRQSDQIDLEALLHAPPAHKTQAGNKGSSAAQMADQAAG